MRRIELSIKADENDGYVDHWGLWEGVREVMQNAKDAEVEHNASLMVYFRKETGTLFIVNEGCTLPYEAMLMGHSTKRHRSDLIGKIGEGFNLGILALLRKGLTVKIRSGSEVWIPSIQRSETFNAQVLCFSIDKGRKEMNRVAVEIARISEGDWLELERRFLFLKRPAENESITTYSGDLLLGAQHKGKLFAKGIYVADDPKVKYGYNFANAQLDRDRKMIEQYNLQYHMQEIWRNATATRPDLFEAFGEMIDEQAADMAGVNEWNAKSLPEALRNQIVAKFQERYGENALPVDSLATSQEVEHFGKRGIICPKPMQHILESVLGTVAANKSRLAEETVGLYGWCEIDEVEQANIFAALALINPVEALTLEDIDVAEFLDKNLRGLFKLGRVQIAKKILSDRSATLRTLIHEVAHRHGSDGEKDHVGNIERIWAGIVETLRSN
jgi:hypothetical protein